MDLLYDITFLVCVFLAVVCLLYLLILNVKEELSRSKCEQLRRDKIVENMAENNVILADIDFRLSKIEEKLE